MKLIDLDSLPKESMTRMTLRGVAEVDAIPISWILKWSAEHMNEYGTVTIAKMLEDWRKYENYRESAGYRKRETIEEKK